MVQEVLVAVVAIVVLVVLLPVDPVLLDKDMQEEPEVDLIVRSILAVVVVVQDKLVLQVVLQEEMVAMDFLRLLLFLP